MKEKRQLRKLMILCVAIILAFLSMIQVAPSKLVNAVTVTGYSGVVSDLNIDDNFNIEDYPSDSEDMSLKVIQIAESTGGELFIYVYQPSAMSKQFELTTISISQAVDNENASWTVYKLKLIDSDGTLAKYKVVGIKLKSSTLRCYDITEIHRKFDETIDTQPKNVNTITEIACDISQKWQVFTVNGKTHYDCVETETIVITDKYVGFVRYEDSINTSAWGAAWGTYLSPGMDSHFIAFSTNKNIDKLMEADVYFQKQSFESVGGNITYGSIENQSVTINYTQKIEGIAGQYKYEFNRIQTVDEFFETENKEYVFNGILFNRTTEVKLTEESKQYIEDMQWVLRFYESDYANYTETTGSPLVSTKPIEIDKIDKTLVSNVTILRLKFETEGTIYNLGIIDNKTNGTGTPDNLTTSSINFNEEFLKIVKLVLGVLAIILILSLIGPFLPKILDLIVVIISFPFKLIGKLFSGKNSSKNRNRR